MKISDELNIKKLLFNKYSLLGKLCSKAEKINQINIVLQQYLQNISHQNLKQGQDQELDKNNIIYSTQVCSIKNNIVYIETSRAEYLTMLKFYNNDILNYLRQIPSLAQIIKINYKINPDLAREYAYNSQKKINRKSDNYNSSKLSHRTMQQTDINLDKITNNSLKQALKNLFNNVNIIDRQKER